MTLWSRLRWKVRHRTTRTRYGSRRVSFSAPRDDAAAEDALRAQLQADPNDVRAFDALVALVERYATADSDGAVDPLHASGSVEQPGRRGEAATWAVAEEFAGHTTAWYPLLELARLSIKDDLEAAKRRLATAADRESSGTALADGVALLSGAGHPVDALGLGVGHWRTMSHVPRVGRELVLAALAASRVADARRFCDALAQHPDVEAVAAMRAEVDALVQSAEQREGGV